MAVSKSSLSAGEIIRAILVNDPEVSARTSKIFPVVVDSAELPYIIYRRANFEQLPVKGQRGSDTVAIEIYCFTEHYTEGIELAEAVRDALDGAQGAVADGSLTMRACYLADGEEAWEDDAYLQKLVFNVKI